MKLSFLLSSTGGSPLQVGLERGLVALGHSVSYYPNGPAPDLIVAWSQSAHRPYVYPESPTCQTPLAFVDSSEYGWGTRKPELLRSFANFFAAGSLKHDTKVETETLRLKRYLEGRSFPYFLREFYKDIAFPDSYHPIDYPLYLGSMCPARPTLDDYVARQEDLFLSWGISHPWRRNLTDILRQCPARSTVLALEENGTPRMPQAEMFARTRGAKCSVSFDGYGSSSFRLTEVIVRTLLLRGPLCIKLRDDLTDGLNCVDYAVEGDHGALARCEGFVSSDICEKLAWVLEDPERAFRIYERGFHHANEKWSETATAQYFLNTVAHHDYSKPTPLDL
jgi:hypothetical protein